MSAPKTQISPVPPDAYGERFINFITGITMTEEEAERRKVLDKEHTRQSNDQNLWTVDGPITSLDVARRSSHSDRLPRSSVEKTIEKAQKQAEKSERNGANEQAMPERILATTRSSSAERTHGQAGSTLPVVEEVGEGGSTGGRSGTSVGGSVVDEKERGGERGEESKGRIRRVISSKEPSVEKADGLLNPPVLPPLTSSPATMDPEKSLVGGSEKPQELYLRHAT